MSENTPYFSNMSKNRRVQYLVLIIVTCLRIGNYIQWSCLFSHSHHHTITPSQHLEVHDTIAECMILANHWVAKKLLSSLPTSSLLRRHPAPTQGRFSHLTVCARVKRFEMATETNLDLARSLDRAVDSRDPAVNKVSLYLEMLL